MSTPCEEFRPLVNGGGYRGTLCAICGNKEAEHGAKPLDFITVRDVNGRASSFAIYGRQKRGHVLRVTGNLEHNAGIAPDTKADADKWIAWLQEWKERAK